MPRFLTHYLRGDLVEDHWVPLFFITCDPETPDRFYFAFEKRAISVEDVHQRVQNNEAVELKLRWPIMEGQAVWGTASGDVWVASADDPLEDINRTLVEEGMDAEDAPQHEIIFRRKGSERQLLYFPDDFIEADIYAKFSDTVAHALAASLGATVVRMEGVVATWEVLCNYVSGHLVDFCGLPYNLHPFRRTVNSVVQFGTQPTYTCYFCPDARKFKRAGCPLLDPHGSSKERLLYALHADPQLEIGGLDDTTATNELYKNLRNDPALAERGRLYVSPNRDDLKNWLLQKTESRMIICDHSIARKLDQAGLAARIEHTTPRSTLHYKEPLPVGFVYRRKDERWGQAIREATRVAIGTYLFDDHGYEKFSEALAELDVKALTKERLCEEFNISDSKEKTNLRTSLPNPLFKKGT